MISGNSKSTMQFEFRSEDNQPRIQKFAFKIKSQNVSQDLYIMGEAHEPVVFFDRKRVEFIPQLVGGVGTAEVDLISQEDKIPVEFTFEKNRAGESGQKVITIKPNHGFIPPNGRVTLHLTMRPKEAKHYN